MNINIDDFINEIESYKNSKNLGPVEMCELLGMGSPSTYWGFVNKKQESKFKYIINFINNTGENFERVLGPFDKSSEDEMSNPIINATPPSTQNHCKNKHCIEDITLLKRNNEMLLNYIDELKEKILRLQSEKGDKPSENLSSGGVEKARRTG